MPALSFQERWVDPVLRSDKEQSTRPQTDRFKVGDVCHIYNQQRRRITDKMMRRVTPLGEEVIIEKIVGGAYPEIPDRVVVVPEYYAHFLGKVEIMRVYNIRPCRMTGEELEAWAWADGFRNFVDADVWFMRQYDEYWIDLKWTVIKWNGWMVRYFEPGMI